MTKLIKQTNDLLKNFGSKYTQARVGLSKSGAHLSTTEVLKFNLDHAKARDAVHAQWKFQTIMQKLEKAKHKTLLLNSQAFTKEQYLLNPDIGRQLRVEDEAKIKELNAEFDISFVVTDGLSAIAIEKNFLPFWSVFYNQIKSINFNLSPITFIPFGRVAIADHVGENFKSKMSIIFVGERPGLSASDSMGIYFTFNPKIGRQNSERNCISNVREPHGLSYTQASNSLLQLITNSNLLGYSGTLLKTQD